MNHTNSSAGKDPYLTRWKYHLAGMDEGDRAHYERLQRGRLNVDGSGPMRLTETICAETVQIVLRERAAAGHCCLACQAKAEGRARRRSRARQLVASGIEISDRRLTVAQLRERLARLNEIDPLRLADDKDKIPTRGDLLSDSEPGELDRAGDCADAGLSEEDRESPGA